MKLKSIFQSITTANVLLILLLVVVIVVAFFYPRKDSATTTNNSTTETTDKFSGYRNQLEKGKRPTKVAKKK